MSSSVSGAPRSEYGGSEYSRYSRHARADEPAAAKGGDAGQRHRRHRSSHHHRERRRAWPESSVTTALGASLGFDSEREHERLAQ